MHLIDSTWISLFQNKPNPIFLNFDFYTGWTWLLFGRLGICNDAQMQNASITIKLPTIFYFREEWTLFKAENARIGLWMGEQMLYRPILFKFILERIKPKMKFELSMIIDWRKPRKHLINLKNISQMGLREGRWVWLLTFNQF